MSSYKNFTTGGFMKNKITFLLITVVACCAAVGNSAGLAGDASPATTPDQPPEAVSQALQAKLAQVRAALLEARDLLKQEEKNLAQAREQKTDALKSEEARKDDARLTNVAKEEIKKLRSQIGEAEKEQALLVKQAENCSRVQDEFAQIQKESLEAESRNRLAEEKLSVARKTLAELNNRYAEISKQVNDSKKQGGDIENARAALEKEKSKREEALKRVEKVVAMAEKAEKERLLLASRLAELEQNLSAQQQDSPERARIQSELENERKVLRETEEKVRNETKACDEKEKAIAELREKLKASEKAVRSNSQKEDDTKHLQARLEKVRSRRAEAEEQLKKAEAKLKEGEESAAVLTNMIAAAGLQQEKDKETARTIAGLTDELNKETARANEITARVDKQDRDLKALEDEKIRLNQNLILVKEKLGREEQNVSKLDAIGLQIAEQKKIRADMETRLQQAGRDQDALKKETEQLNQALVEAGNLIMKNEKDFKKTGEVAGELQKEKELARKAADLLREKEQDVKQLADAKVDLQNKLNDAQAKLAQQKEQAAGLEGKRRALDEEKKAKLASEKKYSELAQTEAEYKAQVKELKSQLSAATKKSKAAPGQETLVVAQAKTESSQNSTASGPGAKDAQGAANMPASSDKAALSTEEDILNKARASNVQASGQDAGAGQRQEKESIKQTASRRGPNKLAQAEEHYALGIQKWDENDLDGAIAEFEKTTRLNPDAAGAYYNICLVYIRQGKKKEACDYAYQAGECYVKVRNLSQAARMAVLLAKIDQDSPLIAKLRKKIAAAPQQ